MTDDNQLDLTGCKILVVDDVPANLDVLVQSLTRASYEILVATSGEESLKVAANTRPDLVLLDVMMPGIDGYEVCERLKADPELRDIPVLFLTARDDLAGVGKGFASGGADYITKPFNQDEVAGRIRTQLERRMQFRQLEALQTELQETRKRQLGEEADDA